jgi:membrane protein DedA with SNARE-associated domain
MVAGTMVASVLTSITDWLEDISAHWWFLVVILVIAFLDSVVPVVPSETTVILGGIAAGMGHHSLFAVIACGAAGAWLGDNAAYMLGRRAGPWIERRYGRSEKGAKRLLWAKEQLERRGALLLITARFIPGGRTVITLTSGITRQPRVRFAIAVAAAAVIWASYAGTLGYVFGERFKDDHTTAFWLAFATALSVTVLIEVVRWARHRRAARAGGS